MNYGMTPQGFLVKPAQAILASIQGRLYTTQGADLDLDPDDPIGSLLAACSQELAEAWVALGDAANATNRGAAEGWLLANIGTLNGTPPLGQSASTVTEQVAFSAVGASPYATGALVVGLASPGSGSVQFQNAQPVVVPGIVNGNAISTTNPYIVQLPFESTTIGPDDGSALNAANGAFLASAPQGGAASIAGVTGNVATVTGVTGASASMVGALYTLEGAANEGNNGSFPVLSFTSPSSITILNPAAVAADARNGSIAWAPASTGQLSNMVPVTGWLCANDVGGVTLGLADPESDTAYRLRQREDLAASGNCTVDATRAAILEALANAPNPVAASVEIYENKTSRNDPVTGLPPKSYMVVVFDGVTFDAAQNDPLIAQAIWDNDDGGILSQGQIAATAIDSAGNERTAYFTRTAPAPIYLSFTVATATPLSADQQTALKATIFNAIDLAAQGQPYTMNGATVTPMANAITTAGPGTPVVASVLRAIVQGQAGVVDVPAATFLLGTAPAPSSTANLPIGILQVPTYALANIVLTCVPFNAATASP